MKEYEKTTLNKIIDVAGMKFRPECIKNIRIGFQKAIKKQKWQVEDLTVKKLMTEVDDDFLAIMKRIDVTRQDIEQEAQAVIDMLKQGKSETESPYIEMMKTGRNEPCPCGSGKKYKKCCGR